MKIVRELDPDRWKTFVDENSCGNIYHTPEMFEVFSRTKGHTPELWAAVDDAGDILALLPIVKLNLLDGPMRRLTTRAVSYGSVLCVPDARGQVALRFLLETYNKQEGSRALFTELRHISDLNSLRPTLAECGYEYEDHLNFLIDLTEPQDVIWKKIAKSAQQRIRTSRNKGTQIEVITERENLDIAYRFLEDVYERVQIPLADKSLFQAAFDVLAPKGMIQMLLARAGEQYAATALLLTYHGRIIYWYIGADRALSAYSPSEFLVWHALQWGNANGYQSFDFGGGGKPDQKYGPRDFKSKFGGVEVNYGRHICVHSPLRLKLSEAGYQLYRRSNLIKSLTARLIVTQLSQDLSQDVFPALVA
ncbi:MAG: GNAT family N-acetyltransferase [Chloroflexi bacterium]|nr:GNAT family N-acetyltransferase [Chloroflexota bacterium]